VSKQCHPALRIGCGDDHWLGETWALLALGMLHRAESSQSHALGFLDEAHTVARRTGMALWQARMHAEIGAEYCDAGDSTGAETAWRHGHDLFAGIGSAEAERVAVRLREPNHGKEHP
jgi:hypothetical protein